MKKLFAGLLLQIIVLVFTCGLAVSVEPHSDKVVSPPAKIDKTKTEQGKKKVESKDVKGKTEKNATQKTDKALGEGTGGPRIPPPGGVGPVGKGAPTSSDKIPAAASKQQHETAEKAINNMK